MDVELCRIFDESIKLEGNVGDLYVMFQDALPEDAGFWRELIIEERRHAALLETGKTYFAPVSESSVGLLACRLDDLQEINAYLVKLFGRYKRKSPSREEAFNTALQIERSAGEIHFQEFMEKEADSRYAELFQKMNTYDKDHESRIKAYMNDHGIQIGDMNS
jgi:hypothetical protein